MSSEPWTEVKLDEVVEITSSKRIFLSDYVSEGVPFFRSKEIIERFHGKAISTELFISEEKFEEIKSKFGVPIKDDILLTSVGTIGIPMLVKGDDRFYFKDGNLTWIRKYKNGIAAKYLFYWLISPNGKEKIQNNLIGSTQQALTIQALKSILIPLPPLPTQRRIVAILTALDDKIELNRRMNETLEGIAQALWGEWFGRYASGEEELPEGWKWGKLNEMYKTTSGGTPSRVKTEFFENGTIQWVKSKELKEIFVIETEERITELALKNSSAKLLPAKSVLVAMYGATVGEVSILSKSATCNQAVCAILPNSNYPFSYAFQFLSNEKKNLKNLATGAAQQNISQELIQNLELPIPSVFDLKKYQDTVEPLFETILINLQQSRTLTALRDVLLPRLMRGEVLS
jgi:type I restriction enzyme S subunit